jgi:hypothetical protein
MKKKKEKIIIIKYVFIMLNSQCLGVCNNNAIVCIL